jgi:hypothetical protein
MEFQVTGSPKAYRNAYGLCVDQYITLGGGYVINVTTMKRYGGALATTANVERRLSDDAYITEPFSDWSKTYISTRVRCTAKAVEAQAAEGLAMALADAQAVYNQYVSAGKIDIPAEDSLLNQVAAGGGDAWVAAAKSGQIMRIM